MSHHLSYPRLPLRPKATRTIPRPETVQQHYKDYLNSSSSKKQVRALWKLLKVCHKNHSCQEELAKILGLPAEPGPVLL